MCHVEGREPGRLASGGTISLEGIGCDHWPARVIAVTSLEDGVLNCAMLLLNNTICLGVVWRDANVLDAIPIREPIEGCNVRRAIVGDNLSHCSPLA
jgi:hypothetical protein